MHFPLADLDLSRRLERAEARSNAAFVTARAELVPGSGATWCEIAGAYAMFDGVGSPLTQTFGLGLFAPVGDQELERCEEFFAARGADVFHEVSPLAGPELVARLGARGYRPVELTSVLYRPTGGGIEARSHGLTEVRVRPMAAGEEELWARIAAEGWASESAELAGFVREIGRVSAHSRGSHPFFAEVDGQPVAAAALSLANDGVALLAGASTLPTARRRGAQLALLDARLRYAAEHGHALAMMGAAPGSGSQRNAERQGFRIAYTRIKWHRPRDAA